MGQAAELRESSKQALMIPNVAATERIGSPKLTDSAVDILFLIFDFSGRTLDFDVF
ncbi:MAG: hypothetical protein NWR54_15200 [Paracoccaceae bacterium]|nr:hypothetical protein [Paracoccaceae bacterium]